MKKLATKLKHRKNSKATIRKMEVLLTKLYEPLEKCIFRFIYSDHLAVFIIIIMKINTIGRGPIKKLLRKA